MLSSAIEMSFQLLLSARSSPPRDCYKRRLQAGYGRSSHANQRLLMLEAVIELRFL